MHQLKAFCDQLYGEDRNACDVAAGSCEAGDEANFDWVGTDKKRSGLFGSPPWQPAHLAC